MTACCILRSSLKAVRKLTKSIGRQLAFSYGLTRPEAFECYANGRVATSLAEIRESINSGMLREIALKEGQEAMIDLGERYDNVMEMIHRKYQP